MQVVIRCRYCGARETLTAGEVQSLRGLVRTCTECRAGTPWDIQGTASGAFAAARLEQNEGQSPAVTAVSRVLVVDDDSEILTIIGRALSREDLDLEMVTSGREALQRLAREDFDLILSDVRMPDFDGKQLFKFLDEHMPEQRDKVIFLTGDLGTPSTVEFFQQVGAPYLPKPLDLALLTKMVRDRLGRTQGGAGAAAPEPSWRRE